MLRFGRCGVAASLSPDGVILYGLISWNIRTSSQLMTRPKLWVSNIDRVDNWEAETKMSRGRQFLGIKKFHLLLLEMRRPKQIFFGVSWWSVNGVGHWYTLYLVDGERDLWRRRRNRASIRVGNFLARKKFSFLAPNIQSRRE